MGQGKRYNTKTKKSNTNNALILFILIITIGIIGTIIGTRSKYVEKEEDIHQINTSDFYFESNYLSEEEKEYDYNDWNGQNKYDIEFKISNYADKLRVSDTDIEYDINTQIIEPQSTENIKTECTINGVTTNTGKIEKNESTGKDDDIKISVTTNGGKVDDKVTLKVTATAKSPYTKTIQAIYKINVSDQKTYDISLKDEGDYERLVIKTYYYSAKMKITYPEEKLILYKESIAFENATIENGVITIPLEKNSNYDFKFVKKQAGTSVELGKDIKVSGE